MRNKYILYSLIAIVILLVGSVFYYFIGNSNMQTNAEKQIELYTCPMHPEIIRNAPGNCPICGMTLVKKVTEKQPIESHSIKHLLQPTDQFVVGDYETIKPKDTAVSSQIYLPGIVTYDSNSAVNIVARVGGRIERMYVNFKFQKVNKGQKIFDLYSPELLTEQQNFIYLITNDAENNSIIKASKEKLLLYGMTLNQINSLAVAKRTNPVITIFSPANGVVQATATMSPATSGGTMGNKAAETTALKLKEGDYIKKNEVVFKLMNTDKVWAVFNIMQGDASFIKVNQPIRFSTEFDENNFVNAKVNFIEIQFDKADKTNKIRVYLNNNRLNFPIGLRLNGVVETNQVKGIWIPKQAMISIGTKKIVFVKTKNGFQARAIKKGIEFSDFVQLIEGITVEDEIVANAQYLMDSESFIKTE